LLFHAGERKKGEKANAGVNCRWGACGERREIHKPSYLQTIQRMTAAVRLSWGAEWIKAVQMGGIVVN